MSPAPVILVPGTWSEDATWWRRTAGRGGSTTFRTALEAQGLALVDHDDLFSWSCDLDGSLIDRITRRYHRDWIAGGDALRWYAHEKYPPLRPEAFRRVSVVAHSHGGQVAAYAAASGLEIETLITVATPVRKDMGAIYEAAVLHSHRWIHLHSDGSDRWQWFGELFDGAVGIRRVMPLAGENMSAPGVGHAGLLDPALWAARGWWALLGA